MAMAADGGTSSISVTGMWLGPYTGGLSILIYCQFVYGLSPLGKLHNCKELASSRSYISSSSNV